MAEIRIYADEDVDVAIVEGLRRRGIEAYSFLDFGNRAGTDAAQIEFARSNGFVLLTHDADFIKIVHERDFDHAGIFFVAQTKYAVGEIIRQIEYVVSVISAEDMKNHIEFL